MSSSPEYYNINQGASSLSFSTIYITPELMPKPKEDKAKEGLTNAQQSVYDSIKYDDKYFYNDKDSNRLYDYDPSGKILVFPPHHPLYVPTLDDTRMQDELTMLSQNNVIFALSAIAGVSVLILGVFLNRSSSS